MVLPRVLALGCLPLKVLSIQAAQNNLSESAKPSLLECNGLPLHWFNLYSQRFLSQLVSRSFFSIIISNSTYGTTPCLAPPDGIAVSRQFDFHGTVSLFGAGFPEYGRPAMTGCDSREDDSHWLL